MDVERPEIKDRILRVCRLLASQHRVREDACETISEFDSRVELYRRALTPIVAEHRSHKDTPESFSAKLESLFMYKYAHEMHILRWQGPPYSTP